jgi:hypothetical protein
LHIPAVLIYIRFDLQNSNVSDPSLDEYDLDKLADVVSFFLTSDSPIPTNVLVGVSEEGVCG